MTIAEPLPLIDHHVHGVAAGALDGPGVEALLSESPAPAPQGTSAWDSQLGIAVRRWCAPVLDLEPSVPAERYLQRRAELGPAEVDRRLLHAAAVEAWLVDSGWQTDQVLTPGQLAGRRALRGRVRRRARGRHPRRGRAQVHRGLPVRA